MVVQRQPTKTCPRCGETAPVDAWSCPKCGLGVNPKLQEFNDRWHVLVWGGGGVVFMFLVGLIVDYVQGRPNRDALGAARPVLDRIQVGVPLQGEADFLTLKQDASATIQTKPMEVGVVYAVSFDGAVISAGFINQGELVECKPVGRCESMGRYVSENLMPR